jgi:hypothetical protein
VSGRVAVVPAVPALLEQYSSLTDPVAELRRACQDAVAWLLEDAPTTVSVVGDVAFAMRIARELLPDCELVEGEGPVMLVVANGSARRGEKAPGHLDDRAFGFDAAIGAALTGGDPQALAGIDEGLGEELLAAGLPALRTLASLEEVEAKTWYDADPFGVQYWVVTWACAS